MKIVNSLLVSVAVLISSIAFAQNSDNPWYIGVGAHATDHTAKNLKGFGDTDDMSFTPPLSKITVARSINRSFAVDIQASVGEVDDKYLQIKDELFVLAGAGVRYKFANGYLIGENSWFDPYLRVGGNYHKYAYSGLKIVEGVNTLTAYDEDGTKSELLTKDFEGQDDSFVVNGGLGINFWIAPTFGINLESQYNMNLSDDQNYTDFLQHSVSFVFRFGNTDKDKDGIKDKDDECPEIPGIAEFNGCPDTDGDGIKDSEDECPTEAGPKENNGCPWGDEDGDGVTDNLDDCVDEAGPAENNGCPWPDTDGDGILDKDDKCPNEACPAGDSRCTNDGCKRDIVKEATKQLEGLLFDSAKATIRPEGKEKLDTAAQIIKDAQGEKFYVDGHTDNTGSLSFNRKLSVKRAQAVVKALEERGVSAGTLEARGFGPDQPIADNDTPEGRQQNRRVVITASDKVEE
ncbi:MAG: OmpA family protein [Flavobacteriales bacterium]|nr:OmpA family protein [Flavobacteriales bacterium]